MLKLYISKLTIDHLKDVAKLEQEVYPEELRLGYEDYLYDFNAYKQNNSSLGVFSDGELKGYIICYQDGRQYYISDLVCKNPKLLLPLLLVFVKKNLHKTFKAELRYTSYRLFAGKKYPFVKVLKMKKVPCYYFNGEDMYEMVFRIDSRVKDPKYAILTAIYEKENQMDIQELLFVLKSQYGFSENQIKKYEPFILKHLNSKNKEVVNNLLQKI